VSFTARTHFLVVWSHLTNWRDDALDASRTYGTNTTTWSRESNLVVLIIGFASRGVGLTMKRLNRFSWIATANQIRQALSSLVQEETDKSSSTRPTSPEIGSGQRKQIVVREAADSSVVESNKEPAIYGLDLDPMATYKSNVSSVAASEDDRAAEQAKANNKVYDSGVVVSVSPAMKVLRAFTPSRKNLTPSKKSQFTFEEGIGDNKGRQEDDDSRTEEY